MTDKKITLQSNTEEKKKLNNLIEKKLSKKIDDIARAIIERLEAKKK